MGISTFVHLLSDDEIALLLELKAAQNGEFDGVIKALIHALCERPHFHNDEEDRGITVDFADALRKELEKEAGTGNAVIRKRFFLLFFFYWSQIRLEQKTKFWEAKIDGTCVEVVYGKKKTKGQTNKHEAGSAAAARDYFDKKVHEKKRGGYKQVKVADPVADMKKSLLEKLGSSAESSSKKAKPVLRHRADFDKCCEVKLFDPFSLKLNPSFFLVAHFLDCSCTCTSNRPVGSLWISFWRRCNHWGRCLLWACLRVLCSSNLTDCSPNS